MLIAVLTLFYIEVIQDSNPLTRQKKFCRIDSGLDFNVWISLVLIAIYEYYRFIHLLVLHLLPFLLLKEAFIYYLSFLSVYIFTFCIRC